MQQFFLDILVVASTPETDLPPDISCYKINLDEKEITKLEQRAQIPPIYSSYEVSAISLDYEYLCIAVKRWDENISYYPDILVLKKDSPHSEPWRILKCKTKLAI